MFINELTKITGLPFNEAYNDYKIINIGGKTIYVQNYIKLLVYNTENIVLKVKNNELNICGNNLKITELGLKDIIINGNIYKTFLSKNEVQK